MASIFRYGAYTFVSENGILGPGQQMSLAFEPWDWWGDSVTVTAHPFALAGANREVEIHGLHTTARPNGNRGIGCYVRNIGPDRVNFAVWVTGIGA